MKILIGCEESGVLRRAFRARNHQAWSNDLLAARDGDPHHLQMDVFDAISAGPWNIIILHPPCTALAVSGNPTYGQARKRAHERPPAIEWTVRLWNHARAHAERVALENPVSVLWPHLNNVPVQYVQPWWFGHPETKTTGFALHRLPPLFPTDNAWEPMMRLPRSQRNRIHFMPPGPHRARARSETFPGLAAAIADQWGTL